MTIFPQNFDAAASGTVARIAALLSALLIVGSRTRASRWFRSVTDYRRIANSTIRALGDARPSVGMLLCIAFNLLLIAGVGALCVSGCGFAAGLSIVVLSLMPALTLLNIGLFASMEEARRPSPLRARSEAPSIVPDKSEPALDESGAAEQNESGAAPQYGQSPGASQYEQPPSYQYGSPRS